MGKLTFIKQAILLGSSIFILSCSSPSNNQQINQDPLVEENYTSSSLNYELKLEELQKENNLPSLHSGAYAIKDSFLVVIGGRIDGFHGLLDDNSQFRKDKANTSVWLLDFKRFVRWGVNLDTSLSNFFQLSSTNMQFAVDKGKFYLVGGFGRGGFQDKQSNTTFGSMIVFDLEKLILAIQNNKSPATAIDYEIQDEFLAVTGGELLIHNDTFFLCMGQKFDSAYTVGYTGKYTDAIRKFTLNNGKIAFKDSITNAQLHRRDLNVLKAKSRGQYLMLATGGVFTDDGDGFANPITLNPLNSANSIIVDSLEQKTNHYNCAKVPMYSKTSGNYYLSLIGGIGRHMLDPKTGKLVLTDMGSKLPFVNLISNFKIENGIINCDVQLPPQYILPELLGTNSIFVPKKNMVLEGDILNADKLQSGDNLVGYLFGGIVSSRPTSNAIYSTNANRKIYKVIITLN